MADFNIAQPYVRADEGGYANVHGDKGGETYAGISRVFHPDWPGWSTIDSKPHPIKWNTKFPDLNPLVDSWYDKNEWDTILGDQIADQNTATYFYDWHVNSGGAVKQVQKVVGVTPDGEWGPHSLAALNAGDYLLAIHNARLAYYKSLNQPQFEPEWLERANSLYSRLTATT